jgi:hypothetical protein
MEEDTLDAVAVPLRRLFAPEEDGFDYNPDDLLLPAPHPLHQIVQIEFVAPLHQHCPKESESSYRTIALSLFVDPRPGCGGIAWPAGEVGPYMSLTAIVILFPRSSSLS